MLGGRGARLNKGTRVAARTSVFGESVPNSCPSSNVAGAVRAAAAAGEHGLSLLSLCGAPQGVPQCLETLGLSPCRFSQAGVMGTLLPSTGAPNWGPRVGPGPSLPRALAQPRESSQLLVTTALWVQGLPVHHSAPPASLRVAAVPLAERLLRSESSGLLRAACSTASRDFI